MAIMWTSIVAVLCAGESPALMPADPRQVQLGGELGRRAQVTVENNLLVIDIERDFLQPFRERSRSDGYVGLGKLIDSMVRLSATTGDERLRERKDFVLRETIACQQEDGYLGIINPENRTWKLWDVHEMSYLVNALAMDHRYFGTDSSLAAARRLADYIIARLEAAPEKRVDGGDLTPVMGTCGLGEGMLRLYEETQDAKYVDFVRAYLDLPDWDLPIVIGRWGRIEGHGYAYMSRCIEQAWLSGYSPFEDRHAQCNRALDFLTKGDGLVVTGTCGYHECWHDNQDGTINLGETCTAVYLLRFLDYALRQTGDARYGDFMERTIFNALFASQSPDGRQIRYYTPFDGPRSYYDTDTYCCPCNYRRGIADLAGYVYYRAGDGVAINLYGMSEGTVTLADDLSVTLRQKTDYPSSGEVSIEVQPTREAEFDLLLRMPLWCRGPSVAVNGEAAETVQPGSYHRIRRSWKGGDTVTLSLPMPVRFVKGRKMQAGRVALMRGPQVYCLNRSGEGLADIDLRLVTLDPDSVSGASPDTSVRPEGTSLTAEAWGPGAWYPFEGKSLRLTLTEYPDPAGEATYFHVPNPEDPRFVDDELEGINLELP